MSAPCYKCNRPEKQVGCHATCPEYLQFCDDREKYRNKKHKIKELEILDRDRTRKFKRGQR